MQYTRNSGSKILFISDHPSRTDLQNGFIWSNRTARQILSDDLNVSETDCTFTCYKQVPSQHMLDDLSDNQIRQWQQDLIMLAAQLQPEIIATTSPEIYDLFARKKIAGGVGKRRGMIQSVDFGGEKPTKLIATANPEMALYRSASREDFIADMMSGIASTQPERNCNFIWVDDPEQLIKLTDNIIEMSRAGALPINNMVAIDTETSTKIAVDGWPATAYHPENNLATVQVCWAPGQAMTIPFIRDDSVFNNDKNIAVARNQLKRILDEVAVCGHNYRYDECYFNVKLGLKTEKFAFDSMLAHHFLHSHLPKSLDFVVSRWLGWPSHKKIIKDELDAMPKEIRSYALLSQPVIHKYGCLDVDATLQASGILMNKLGARRYDKYVADGINVEYDNALQAFNARVMFPWRAMTDMEVGGALMDIDRLPEVANALKADMDAAFERFTEVPAYANWIQNNTEPNPKRFKAVKKSFWYSICRGCGFENKYLGEGRKPKEAPECPGCKSADTFWKRRMEPTGEKKVVEDQPEMIHGEFKMSSTKILKEFFYDSKYLAFPISEKFGTSTDKASRAALRKYAESHNLQDHVKAIDALTDYNKASKLYTAYATKIGDYLWVREGDSPVSGAVTKPYEVPLPVNFVHTQFLQDGTHSGRLSSRSPSLHTIPRDSDIKKLFTSRFGDDGLILQADLSQAEVRAFCIESLDESLQDAFVRGVDPYIGVAAKIAGISEDEVTKAQRQETKSVVLGLLYGRGPGAIAEQTGKTIDEARQIIKDFFASAPKVEAWVGRCHDFVHKHKVVVSRFGRVRDMRDDINSDDGGKVNHAENVAQNHPIQSLVGDLGVDSVARIFYRMQQEGLKSVLFNTVHDSTIFDVYAPELLQVMQIAWDELYEKLPSYYPFVNVPFAIDMDLGLSWGKAVGAAFEGKNLKLKGAPDTVDTIQQVLARHYKMPIVGAPEFDAESNKLGITWNLEND